MKKYLSLLLALSLVAGTVASCGLETTESSSSKKEIVPATSDLENEPSDKKESSDKKKNSDTEQKSTKADKESQDDKPNEKENTNKKDKTKLSIEEQVLWEVDGVTLTAKSIEEDSIFGTGIKVLAENNSDKDVSFFCDAIIVNDYMISDLTSINVTAGNKANENIYLLSSELEAAGIDKIGKIEIYMHMSDPETYDIIKTSECITVKTSLYDEIDTEADTSGTVLLEKDGIKIIGKYVDEDSFWGAAALLYIENNTDKNIIVQTDDVSVNGFMITSLCSQNVYAGKKAFTTVDFFSSSLEENDITSVDTVEMKFKVLDEDYNHIIDTDKISFNAK